MWSSPAKKDYESGSTDYSTALWEQVSLQSQMWIQVPTGRKQSELTPTATSMNTQISKLADRWIPRFYCFQMKAATIAVID